VQDIESSAQEAMGNGVLSGRQLISVVSWDGEVRLTVFKNETLCFDLNGTLIDVGREEAGVCACLVQLVGIWVSPRSWGLRMAVKEMKEVAPSKAPKKTLWAFRDD
jgi:hypothetical protein